MCWSKKILSTLTFPRHSLLTFLLGKLCSYPPQGEELFSPMINARPACSRNGNGRRRRGRELVPMSVKQGAGRCSWRTRLVLTARNRLGRFTYSEE